MDPNVKNDEMTKKPFCWPKPTRLTRDQKIVLYQETAASVQVWTLSKNQKRMASGKRTGNRKRKQGQRSEKRNDWPADRKINRKCEECNTPMYFLCRQRGLRRLYFEADAKEAVLASLIVLFRRTPLGSQSDVVYKILNHVFRPDFEAKQLTKHNQFWSPCGCKYHVKCYQERQAKGKTKCEKHQKK